MALPLVYNTNYVTELPEGHRFPMMKFKSVRDILLQEGLAKSDQFHEPEMASRELLQIVHSADYIENFCSGNLPREMERRIGLPWSKGLMVRTRTAVCGTILTAELALQYGLACNTAGGTHHAFSDFGSGFCIFNDLAVAAANIKQRGMAKKILILDLDVHQGDGTARIFQDDAAVYTFSMHCGANFPFKKQQSDWDVDLPAGMTDEAYLAVLNTHLPELLSRVNPDLVLYDAGVDTHKDDLLGKLMMTDEGLFKRDEMVIGNCLANGFPIACVIGGGYDKNIQRLALRHSILHRVAIKLFRHFQL